MVPPSEHCKTKVCLRQWLSQLAEEGKAGLGVKVILSLSLMQRMGKSLKAHSNIQAAWSPLPTTS